ncbi:MAG TPA: NADH-quinone oxidoreductase subunit A [Dehalococcoidia bacterium]|nr:NADH-quinone oxidoreductase subunit A [Dehalococcoidia bacterium]
MLADYGLIGLFLLLAILFTVFMPLIPFVLRFFGIVPHKPNPVKNSTYECGMETVGKTWVQFNFRYYFYALLFVAFDVLTVFLYPWATNLETWFGLAAIAIFIFIITIGYIYAWKKGVMEWK